MKQSQSNSAKNQNTNNNQEFDGVFNCKSINQFSINYLKIDTILPNSTVSNEIGALNANDTKSTIEARLSYEKKQEIFDKLRWVMIVGEWNNVNDQEKQFNQFKNDKGIIKLRFHYETFVKQVAIRNEHLPLYRKRAY